MQQIHELVDLYFAVWNETDLKRRQELMSRTWTEDAHYCDPLMHGEGHAGIDALVQTVQERFVGYRFRRIGAVDAHKTYVRFSWELAPEGGPAVVAGTDFGVIAGDGRLQRVIGFLDQVPNS